MVVKFLLSYVDGFIAISPLNKKIASNYYPDKPISFVYPYGSNNSFQINCDLNSKNLLFIGNQESCKRFDLLVDAVEILNKKGNEFNLYLVGSCIESVNADFPWLHKEGFQKNLDKYFKNCSLYVHPADFDSCPVTVFETMSSGMIPIITENVGEADILIDNGLEYLVLKDNNPKTIADKILEIHNRDEKWKQIFHLNVRKLAPNTMQKPNLKNLKRHFKKL